MKKARIKVTRGRWAERQFVNQNCTQYIRVSFDDLVTAFGRPSYSPCYTWNILLNNKHVYIMSSDIDKKFLNLDQNKVFDPAKFSSDRFRWEVVTHNQPLEPDVLIALQNHIFALVNKSRRKQNKYSINYCTMPTREVNAFVARHGLVAPSIEIHREDSSLTTIKMWGDRRVVAVQKPAVDNGFVGNYTTRTVFRTGIEMLKDRQTVNGLYCKYNGFVGDGFEFEVFEPNVLENKSLIITNDRRYFDAMKLEIEYLHRSKAKKTNIPFLKLVDRPLHVRGMEVTAIERVFQKLEKQSGFGWHKFTARGIVNVKYFSPNGKEEIYSSERSSIFVTDMGF